MYTNCNIIYVYINGNQNCSKPFCKIFTIRFIRSYRTYTDDITTTYIYIYIYTGSSTLGIPYIIHKVNKCHPQHVCCRHIIYKCDL